MTPPTIYQYIKEEESRFETDEIQVGQNWFWSFKKHVQLIFHLRNGVFFQGDNNWLRAFKNIMEPLLNLSYWAEDIEVKDVVFYIEEKDSRALSFLIKKYHDEVYVKEHNLDTLFDEIAESDLDYGGVLVQKTNIGTPEIFDLKSVAFCDQTDIMGGPLAFKYHFSPDKLRGMSKLGWGDESNGATMSIHDLIMLADNQTQPAGINAQKNRTTGKNIDVYMVRGNLPEAYLKDNDNIEDWYNQVQIVAFYYDQSKQRNGVVLYRKKEEEGNVKFFTSKKVNGRALGRGEGEALLHPQIWTNWLTIHEHNFLEAASKVPLYTDDPAYSNRNRIQEMENLEITTIAQGSLIHQVPTAAPANVQLFRNSVNTWYEQAQLVGSAFDPVLGKEAVSGTTFRGQAQIVQQGKGLHERRRGQRAKFLEEIYRDWIIPDIISSILGGKKFLAELSVDEIKYVSDCLVRNALNKMATKYVLDNGGVAPTPEMMQTYEQKVRDQFTNAGSKHTLEILKGEFEDIPVRMGINIAGKQKDLAQMADKVLSIFQYVGANPQGFLATMQIPGMSDAFNDILEFSGISQVDFSGYATKLSQQTQPNSGSTTVPSPIALNPAPTA